VDAEAASSVVEWLIQSVPKDAANAGDWERLRKFLGRELQGRDDVYRVSIKPPKGERSSGVLSLEKDRAALYRLVLSMPIALTRELLHLKGAAVCHEVPLGSDKEHVSITLSDGRVLTTDPLEAETARELRKELEDGAS
jgi:hypothetical protein